MVALRGKGINVSSIAAKQQQQQPKEAGTTTTTAISRSLSLRKKPPAPAVRAKPATATAAAASRPLPSYTTTVAAPARARKPTAASIAAAAAAKAAKAMPQHVHLLKQQQEHNLTWENKTKPALDAELVRISSVPTSLGVPIPNATGLRENVAKIEHQHMANACRAILSTWSPMLRKAVNKSVNGGFHVFSVPLYIPGESNLVLGSVDEVVRVLAPILKNGGYTIKRENLIQGSRTVRISW